MVERPMNVKFDDKICYIHVYIFTTVQAKNKSDLHILKGSLN